MQGSFPMNGGDGAYSYSRNSQIQREVLDGAKELVREVIAEKLDIKSILAASTTFRIIDLGCSIGPNTFKSMQLVIEALKEKYHNQSTKYSTSPKFQVFFNDHITNDFNTLFGSLPVERSYYAAGIPGSFHGRLMPSDSIQFAHSSCAIHWLSKVPEELVDDKSPAWNKEFIHYVGASDAVVNAYVSQFEKDMQVFLNARSEEIVCSKHY